MANDVCPIWGTPASMLARGARDGTAVDSPRAAGEYFISRTATCELRNLDALQKVLLTSWLVDQRRFGVSCPEIFSTTIDELKVRRQSQVHERADNLLRYLASKSELLGSVVTFGSGTSATAPIAANELMAWTASRRISEVITLAEYAHEEGWVGHVVHPPQYISDTEDTHELMLRPPGFARLSALDGGGSESSQAFVAMWFDTSLLDAYEKGIAMAIRDAGYLPIRIDRKDHNNKIDDEVIAEIRRSRFMVADFTQGNSGARGGVYYEAGFAHGLNIPVIFTCRADVLADVHFDTRQYNHIVWEDPDDLRDLLAKRISATIGDGPVK
jgi:hypothetical protein